MGLAHARLLENWLDSIIEFIVKMPPDVSMKYLLLYLITLLVATTVSGQDILRPEVQRHSWDVFIRQAPATQSVTEVIFVDLLTGDSTSASTNGEQFTLIDDAVLYYDVQDAQVKLVKPDGIAREHPFIVMTSADYGIDWAVSADRSQIVWAVSRKTAGEQLTTSIMLSDMAGSAIRELLVYGPREGIRLLPVAFSADGNSLYVEVHADGTAGLTPYTRRTGLFSLDFGGGNVATRTLPGDATCFCAVGFGEEVMLRLAPMGEAGGISVEIYDLQSGAARVMPPVSRGNYEEAGNVLVSPNGALAVYALSQVSDFQSAQQEIRTVLVLADLENARQTVLDHIVTSVVRPISWTEDNSAILFTLEPNGGTWKMKLGDGRALKVAEATYLGMLSDHALEESR